MFHCMSIHLEMQFTMGRAIAQAVSCWLPTVAAQVRAQTENGICGGQSGNWASFF
jgi:hypothetical protein